MKIILPIVFLYNLFLFSENNGYLYLKYVENINSYGYVDYNGNLVIPFGKYAMCFTDTLKTYAIVYKENEGLVAIDKEENILFHVYEIDNGPDYPSEGYFRIVKNNLVGFAHESGKILVEPQFDSALPFSGGYAAVCRGCMTVPDGEYKRRINGKWGFINREGAIVIQPIFDNVISGFVNGYAVVELNGCEMTINESGKEIKIDEKSDNQWIRLLIKSLQLLTKVQFENQLAIECKVNENSDWIFSNNQDFSYKISFILKDSQKLLAQYLFIPWQYAVKKTDKDLSLAGKTDLITVTDYAIIFTIFSNVIHEKNEKNIGHHLENQVKLLFEYDYNRQEEKDPEIKIPENVRILSLASYPNFIDLQVALPGSILPEQSEWGELNDRKMIRLAIAPDSGDIKTSWIKPSLLKYDTYYMAVESDILSLFKNALDNALLNPDKRQEIFEKSKIELGEIFNAANSYVNFLYDKYENRLCQWLFIPKGNNQNISDEMFPDYQPKLTPDTAIDFLPHLSEKFKTIPQATLANLTPLCELFFKVEALAQKNPGSWKDGNMLLGAKLKEYVPSEEELYLEEIGDRIKSIVEKKTG